MTLVRTTVSLALVAVVLGTFCGGAFAQTTPAPPGRTVTGPGKLASPVKPAPTPPAAAPTTPAASGTPSAPATDSPPGEKEAVQDCKKFPPNKKFKWELRGEVDLITMLNAISPMLCRPFIIPGSVRQSKVTILAPDTMTAPEAYRMFLAALESMGLTVQPEGKVLKVIESARARESALPIYSEGNAPPRQDQYVTRLLRLEHVPVDDVKGVLDRLKGKDGDVTVYAPTNTLVITDLGSNIRKMEEVVQQLDVAMGGERIWVIKLRTLSATDMATTLQQIFGVQAKGGSAPAPAAGAGKSRPNLATPGDKGAPVAQADGERGAPGSDMAISQIIPDDRNNLLIIVGTEKAYQRIYAMVKRLDLANSVRGDSASDVVHVITLANANVDDVASTLSGLGAGVSRSASSSGSTTGTQNRPPAQTPQGNSTTGQKSILFEGDVRIAADKPTNSLVAVATGRDYITLRDLVKQLDIVRRQVFVECVILEVSVNKTRTIGFAWHGGNAVGSGSNQSLLFGGSEPSSDVNSILFSPTSLSGLAAGLRGPAIPNADTILGLPAGTSVPSFGVFVQFLQNNGDVNVVSMPHLLTTDNEKASISVGQNLPFPGALGVSSFGSVGGTGTPAVAGGIGTSVQRQDVALKLDITPHVNQGDFVRLEIENEISDVADPNYNGLGPATTKRTLKTQVTVRDQQTIVLGGLIKDSVSETVQKVPLLGDIPILGYLFKKTNKAIVKQNLLIILTPYIIKDISDMRRLFERKLRERREFMERESAFRDEHDYEAQVDYRRKRGLLEEINRTAMEAEFEAAELRAAEDAMNKRQLEGPLDLPLTRSQLAPGGGYGPGRSNRPQVVPPGSGSMYVAPSDQTPPLNRAPDAPNQWQPTISTPEQAPANR